VPQSDHVSDLTLKEGVDYTIDQDNRYVFTAAYLLRRGTCCGSKCRNCPYDWVNVPGWHKSTAAPPPISTAKE
jgi:Family of unknown function (DUF5522)